MERSILLLNTIIFAVIWFGLIFVGIPVYLYRKRSSPQEPPRPSPTPQQQNAWDDLVHSMVEIDILMDHDFDGIPDWEE